jgi:hypothetical protein
MGHADRKKLNMTPPLGKLNRMRSPNLLIKLIFLRSFLEPQLFGEDHSFHTTGSSVW